jgi:NAD(P)-dependent dehydrogenase (short-subunit alcohol dehydrogenase family)
MVILEYAPITGGAQRQIEAVAPLLARRGVDVHVLTRRSRGLGRARGDRRRARAPARGARVPR